MIGQSRYPYAFMLAGLTTTVVAGNGFNNPDASWQYNALANRGGLSRSRCDCRDPEHTLAAVCPEGIHYQCPESLSRPAPVLLQQLSHPARGSELLAMARIRVFPERITGLRTLLDFGSKESSSFRKRLPIYL